MCLHGDGAYRHPGMGDIRPSKLLSLPPKKHLKVSRIALVHLIVWDTSGLRTDPSCLASSVPPSLLPPIIVFARDGVSESLYACSWVELTQ